MSGFRSLATVAERIWSAVAGIVAACRGSHLSPVSRARAIDLIEGDFDCLVEDASERPIDEQSAKELLLNRDLLGWLRGGPIPGRGAVDLLDENLSAFQRPPAESDRANEKALQAVLDELVRAQGSAAADEGRCGPVGEAAGLTDRERCWFGLRLDELRRAGDLTIGDLAARSGIEVVRIVAFIYGAEEAGASEMMKLAAALGILPRELFPDCLEGSEDVEGGEL